MSQKLSDFQIKLTMNGDPVTINIRSNVKWVGVIITGLINETNKSGPLVEIIEGDLIQ
jgi:hypothetical protein